MFTTANKHLIPRYGKLLNLSTLATLILFMFTTSIIITAFIIYFKAMMSVGFNGANSAIEQIGQSFETMEAKLQPSGFFQLMDDFNIDGHQMLAGFVSTSISQSNVDTVHLATIILMIFFTFVIYRSHLVENNKLWQANQSNLAKEKTLLKQLEQKLGFSPIVSGHHTAFKPNKIWQLFKPTTLVLSIADITAAYSGKFNHVTYKIHHELCHQLSWDMSLNYLVKVISIFNAIVLATFFGFLALLPLLILINFSWLWFSFAIAGFVSYKFYHLFMRSYYLFSMFKEHLADEYALLSTQSIQSAEQAFKALESNKNNLHPHKSTRLEFLQTRQSSYPFKLFLYICLLWLFGITTLNRFNMALVDIPSWIELIFIALNLPLIYFIHQYRKPKATQHLAIISAFVLLFLILLVPLYEYNLSHLYQPTLAKPYIDYFFNNLTWFHGCLAATLFLAQRPRKI